MALLGPCRATIDPGHMCGLTVGRPEQGYGPPTGPPLTPKQKPSSHLITHSCTSRGTNACYHLNTGTEILLICFCLFMHRFFEFIVLNYVHSKEHFMTFISLCDAVYALKHLTGCTQDFIDGHILVQNALVQLVTY